MNRIDQLQPGRTQPETPAKPGVRPEGAPSFQQCLDQANQVGSPDGPRAGQAPLAPAQAPAAAAVGSLASVAHGTTLGPEETEGLLRAERTLDLLEAYQKDLADGKKSLKDIFGVVKALEGELGELMQAMDRLDPDSKLHGLLGEIATQAMVESIKFNRGDYNPSAAETGEEAEV